MINNWLISDSQRAQLRNMSFELYTIGSSMKIQYLTIYQVSSTPIPADLITLNANYSQVLGLNLTGELVCKPALD